MNQEANLIIKSENVCFYVLINVIDPLECMICEVY